ncbi:MAG: purine-binding chemotaxis protein CheW [Spirochaetaceae bacterium]|nr:purine-binding chemotaxis protein CheW [Spirochaetaceae bacterium]
MDEQIISDEQYFTFKLADGSYAVDVTKVKEILEFESVTKIPKALPYMKGVMNCRGSVITVVDLRVLFGFDVSDDLSDTDIVVTELIEGREQPLVVGFIADEVDVVTPLEKIPSESVSFVTMPKRSDFIQAIGKLNNQFVLILDLEKIIATIQKETAE